MTETLEAVVEDVPCAVGMCIFLAARGSNYCTYHRPAEEAYYQKLAAAIREERKQP